MITISSPSQDLLNQNNLTSTSMITSVSSSAQILVPFWTCCSVLFALCRISVCSRFAMNAFGCKNDLNQLHKRIGQLCKIPQLPISVLVLPKGLLNSLVRSSTGMSLRDAFLTPQTSCSLTAYTKCLLTTEMLKRAQLCRL